jgi:hypothetical protein
MIISLDVFRNVKEIFDLKASIGRALELNTCGKMIVLHPYFSIMPGRYEIFWRLRFTSLPIVSELRYCK